MARRAPRAIAAVTVVMAVLGVAGESLAAGGNVLPPQARVRGYSLTDATKAVAAFTTGANDPSLLPDIPFQVLYVDFSTVEVQADGDGILFTGTNSFTVSRSTLFFIPVWNVSDAPPVPGTFPTTRAEAIEYFFDPAQVGGKDFAIAVDGHATPIGPAFLAGPVTTPLTGGGNTIVTVGAFLGPMSIGTHTVRLTGGIFGDFVADFGASHLRQDLVYTVNVVR